MSDTVLPALANTLARYVSGVGHIYDRNDEDPTPDSVAVLSDGKPVGIFIDPYQIDYDKSPRTMGMGAETRDTSTILFALIFGPFTQKKIGTLQRLARPFVRYRVSDAIRQHNTMGGVVWRARVAKASAGSFSYGGADWYAAQFNIIIDDDRDVTPGSD